MVIRLSCLFAPRHSESSCRRNGGDTAVRSAHKVSGQFVQILIRYRKKVIIVIKKYKKKTGVNQVQK